ncbi:MAG: hypothetical protein EBT47_07540, partial [Chloroflexi bacterium]|nr:hypothetical protein [Chloroflexota bacterium]
DHASLHNACTTDEVDLGESRAGAWIRSSVRLARRNGSTPAWATELVVTREVHATASGIAISDSVEGDVPVPFSIALDYVLPVGATDARLRCSGAITILTDEGTGISCGPVNQWRPGNLTPVGAFGKATHRFGRWSGRIGRGRPDRVRHGGPSRSSTVVRTDVSQDAGSASRPNATRPPRLTKIRFACMSPTTERRFALRPRHTGDCGT